MFNCGICCLYIIYVAYPRIAILLNFNPLCNTNRRANFAAVSMDAVHETT